MKVTTDLSIGAALQACASHAPAKEPQRQAAPAARNRDPDLGRNRDTGRDCNPVRDGKDAPEIHLTARQLEVLALLCEGLQNKPICRRLNIATGTVKVHISCILRELGVTSRLAAVVEAQRRGLVNTANVDLGARSRDLLGRLMATGSGPEPGSHGKPAAAAIVAAGSIASRGLVAPA